MLGVDTTFRLLVIGENMTREEFEAVIAIEGRYLFVRPFIRKNEPVLWSAIIWAWYDKAPNTRLLQSASRISGLPQIESPEKFRAVIAATDWRATNYKAVKEVMKDYMIRWV
jgi:hypothetical protein